MTPSKANLLEAVPVYRLACSTTGTTVGIEYRWNTGDLSVLWCDHYCEDVVRQPITGQDLD